jgi:hypothetical protein
MADVIRIVGSIDAAPAVLFDLNVDGGVCGVDGFSAPPPLLVRSSVQTQLRDGATEAGSVYGDRSIEIDLDVFAPSQDESATQLQKLGRLLSDPRGQWLMYQPSGATKPVFFRTKRADISAIEDVLSSTAARQLDLSIPAQPFAYGLPVSSDPFVVYNDVLPGLNASPGSFVVSSVQGDVATPLGIVVSASNGGTSWPCVIASSATPTLQDAPVIGTATIANSPGFTQATFTDSTATGGNTERFTRVSGPTTLDYRPSAFLVPGEYRILARARASDSTTTLRAGAAPSATNVAVASYGAPKTLTQSWQWHDLGVARFPVGQARPSLMPISPLPATVTCRVGLLATLPAGSTGTVDINNVVLVPVGRDDAVDTRFATTTSASPAVAGVGAVFDSIADAAYCPLATANTPIAIAGALPFVVPGLNNFITFMRTVGVADFKTVTTTMTYVYYPRYLYIRPATS